MASTAPSRPGEGMIVAPLPDARTTTGAGAVTILIIEVTALVLSRRRRRKREVETGVEVGAGAGVVREDEAAIVNHHLTAAREKEEERGEGSEVGIHRV